MKTARSTAALGLAIALATPAILTGQSRGSERATDSKLVRVTQGESVEIRLDPRAHGALTSVRVVARERGSTVPRGLRAGVSSVGSRGLALTISAGKEVAPGGPFALEATTRGGSRLALPFLVEVVAPESPPRAQVSRDSRERRGEPARRAGEATSGRAAETSPERSRPGGPRAGRQDLLSASLAWKVGFPGTVGENSPSHPTFVIPYCRTFEFDVETKGGRGEVDLDLREAKFVWRGSNTWESNDDHRDRWTVAKHGGPGMLGGPGTEAVVQGQATISADPGDPAPDTKFSIRLTDAVRPRLRGSTFGGGGLVMMTQRYGYLEVLARDSANQTLVGGAYYKFAPIGPDFLEVGVNRIEPPSESRPGYLVVLDVAYADCPGEVRSEALDIVFKSPRGIALSSRGRSIVVNTVERGTFRYRVLFAGKTASPEKTFVIP